MLPGPWQARASIVGADPYELNRLRSLIRDPRVFGAVEVACPDLIEVMHRGREAVRPEGARFGDRAGRGQAVGTKGELHPCPGSRTGRCLREAQVGSRLVASETTLVR